MAIGRTASVGLTGIDGFIVQVEAQVAKGLPAFSISGLGDSAVSEATDRIKAAFRHLELSVQQRAVVVNLSPASRRKVGSGYDLAIAVATLAGADIVPPWLVDGVVHLGELGLDGTIRGVCGILPAVLAAQRAGIRTVVVPAENASEAALARDVHVVPVTHLRGVIERYAALAAGEQIVDPLPIPPRLADGEPPADLADVVGQDEARLALEVAASGGHHLFMVGPPGTGKTMLAERLVGLLPPLGDGDSLEVRAIRSIVEVPTMPVPLGIAPFVAPHHGCSAAAMIGGGSGRIQPGAITLAHKGVLFLDEAPEFKPAVLQSLRQPLESGHIVVARAMEKVRFPASFQLIMAANPCPCGRLVGTGDQCTCTSLQRRGYLARISGPLLDRVDLQVRVLAPSKAALAGGPGEATADVAPRVRAALDRAETRWAGMPWRTNARVPGPVLRSPDWRLPADRTRELDAALDRGWLTLRGYDRCLRIAWTLADMREASRPEARDLAEALGLRQTGRAA